MATTFNVLYLGNFAAFDTTEGNTQAEQAATFVGQTFGSAGDPLHQYIGSLSPGSSGFAGGGTTNYDQDNNAANDTFTIDGGGDQTFDGTAVFNATLTYSDGTTAAISAVVFQDTAGNTYMSPEFSANADSAAMEAKAIQSLTLDSLLGDSYGGMTADRLLTTFVTPDGVIDGTSGNDVIDASYGDADGDKVDGFDGNNDSILAGDGSDSIASGSGADTIDAGTGNDTISGGDGNDCIFAGSNNDRLLGDDGDDSLDGGVGSDTLYGGSGHDLVIGGGNTGNADLLYGEDGNDTLYGGSGAGADTLYGGTGDDLLDGLRGNDLVEGGTGSDTILLTGDTGNDTVIGGEDADTSDRDVLDASALTGSASVTASGFEAGTLVFAGDTVSFSQVEEFVLTANSDTFDASLSTSAATVDAGSGDDTLISGAGADLLSGGDDDDAFVFGDGAGNDTIDGGEGGSDNDLMDFSALTGPVSLDYSGSEAGTATDGAYTITFTGIEAADLSTLDDTVDGTASTGALNIDAAGGADSIDGGSAGDTLLGGGGSDTIAGGSGADSLSGGGQGDLLDGGSGADTLAGGAGSDTLIGGAGNDCLSGSSGNDLFTLSLSGGNDTITDFASGDQVDVSALTDVGNVLTNQNGVVTAKEVTVTGGGGSDQVLTFPGGETLTVPDGTVDTSTSSAQFTSLVAMGVPPCFAPGTLILTTTGERPVEDLRVGDFVLTADHGPQALRWIGRREVDFNDVLQHRRWEADRPILFSKGSLGNGLPRRDLVVSPQHRMVLSGNKVFERMGSTEALGPAKAMTGLPGVRRMKGKRRISYFALLFDRHEIVFAEGARTESFRPGPVALEGLTTCQRRQIAQICPGLEEHPEAAIGPPARTIGRRRQIVDLLSDLYPKAARNRVSALPVDAAPGRAFAA